MARKPPRKLRVDFRPNRQVRRRTGDWTRQYRAAEPGLDDSQRAESVRAKGDLSRRRTILVDEHDLPLVDESQWHFGTVAKVHGLICTLRDADGRPWECTVRRVLRTLLMETRSPVAVGDRAWFSNHSAAHDGLPVGVIERVEQRSTWLSRRDQRRRAHTLVANADQLLAVVSVAQPRLRPHLVDRYVVAALKGGLRPILCFNKLDLLEAGLRTDDDTAERQSGLSVADVIGEFRALGHTCLGTSAVTRAGIDELRAALQNHTTVLAGQSGVGKSTLLNVLQPALELLTRPVSDATEKGRHTTTLAELLPLEFGGYVVDTPGIRAFDLWSVEPGELEAFFVEFVPYVPQCRFRDCTHRDEAGCAVRAAVAAGEISERRYYSYRKMFEEV